MLSVWGLVALCNSFIFSRRFSHIFYLTSIAFLPQSESSWYHDTWTPTNVIWPFLFNLIPLQKSAQWWSCLGYSLLVRNCHFPYNFSRPSQSHHNSTRSFLFPSFWFPFFCLFEWDRFCLFWISCWLPTSQLEFAGTFRAIFVLLVPVSSSTVQSFANNALLK